MKKLAALLILLLATPALAGQNPAYPVPNANANFMSYLQSYMNNEKAQEDLEHQFTNFIYDNTPTGNACLGAPAPGLTMTIPGCVAYDAGWRNVETNSITFPNNSSCWVAMDANTSGTNTGLPTFTRVPNTHYLIDCNSPVAPALPYNAQYTMLVLTVGGSVVGVTDNRITGFGAVMSGIFGAGSGLQIVGRSAGGLLDSISGFSSLTGTPSGMSESNISSISGVPTGMTISGTATSGADNLSGLNVNQTLTPLSFGAVCDGATDDHTALQNAINAAVAAHKALVWPGDCASSTLLTMTVPGVANGTPRPVAIIAGTGDSSALTMIGSSHSGLLITSDQPGVLWASASVSNLRIVNQETVTSSGNYGLKLNSIANFKQTNVSVYGKAFPTTATLSDGIVFDNCQMGEVAGGSILQTYNGQHYINDLSTCDSNIDIEVHGVTIMNNEIAQAAAVATVSGAANSTTLQITTTAPHGLSTGDTVLIEGVTGNLAANGVYQIIVDDGTHFTLIGDYGSGAYAGGGLVYVPSVNVRIDPLPSPACWTTAANILGAASALHFHGNDFNGTTSPPFNGGNCSFAGVSFSGPNGYSPSQVIANQAYGLVQTTSPQDVDRGGLQVYGNTVAGVMLNNAYGANVIGNYLPGCGTTTQDIILNGNTLAADVRDNNVKSGNIYDNTGSSNNSTAPNSLFPEHGVQRTYGNLSTFSLDPVKLGAPPGAVGAGNCRIYAVAGTNAGSCKLEAICGTSTTPVLIIDNVGSGC